MIWWCLWEAKFILISLFIIQETCNLVFFISRDSHSSFCQKKIDGLFCNFFFFFNKDSRIYSRWVSWQSPDSAGRTNRLSSPAMLRKAQQPWGYVQGFLIQEHGPAPKPTMDFHHPGHNTPPPHLQGTDLNTFLLFSPQKVVLWGSKKITYECKSQYEALE